MLRAKLDTDHTSSDARRDRVDNICVGSFSISANSSRNMSLLATASGKARWALSSLSPKCSIKRPSPNSGPAGRIRRAKSNVS